MSQVEGSHKLQAAVSYNTHIVNFVYFFRVTKKDDVRVDNLSWMVQM